MTNPAKTRSVHVSLLNSLVTGSCTSRENVISWSDMSFLMFVANAPNEARVVHVEVVSVRLLTHAQSTDRPASAPSSQFDAGLHAKNFSDVVSSGVRTPRMHSVDTALSMKVLPLPGPTTNQVGS